MGRLTDSRQTWLPFEDEIFAFKLGGGKSVRRFSRRPRTSLYYANHTPRPAAGGIFSSDWR